MLERIHSDRADGNSVSHMLWIGLAVLVATAVLIPVGIKFIKALTHTADLVGQ